MPSARRLFLRLFLEGVEVPVIGARITISEGVPASATIQIVPTKAALEFHPRTMVHLFCADVVNNPVIEEGDEIAKEYIQVNADPLYDLEGYKIVFSGLLIGFQYLKQGIQRSIILQCLDFSIAWDTTYQYMLTYGPNGSGILGSNATLIGANTNLFDDILNDPVSVTSSLLQRKRPKTPEFKRIKGLLAGIISIIEAIGGIPGDFRGINDFNTVEELRNKLLYQVTTDENDDTSANLFARKAFSQWLNNSLGGMGGLMSTRDILNMVMKYIYYGLVPCPAGSFRPGGEDSYIQPVTKGDLSKAGVAKVKKWRTSIGILYRRIDDGLANLRSAGTAGADAFDEGESEVLLTGTDTGALAKSNPFAATAETASVYRREDFIQQAASEGYDGFSRRTTVDLDRILKSMQQELLDDPAVFGSSASVRSSVDSAYNQVDLAYEDMTGTRAGGSVRSPLASIPPDATSASYRGSVEKKVDLLQERATANRKDARLASARDRLKQAVADLSAALGATTTTNTTVEFLRSPRFNTQILRPDVWFVAPPRCNVLFPEHYNVFQFNRQMLREVTRYQLRTSMELIGPDPLLDYYYKAPDLSGSADISRGTYFADSAVIMKHEVHSGIVPKMHHEGEVSLYASKSIKAYIKELVGQDQDAAKLRNSYAQRVAHWNFFRFRFMPRVISFTGQFNPLPVCGFPMAIIDKPYYPPDNVSVQDLLRAINMGDLENILATNPDVRTVGRSIEGDPISTKVSMPAQFIGQVTNLEHVVDQQGGHTTGQLNFCRTHKAMNGNDDEFLNTRLAEKRIPAGKLATATFLLNYDTLYEASNQEALTVLANLTPQLQTEAASLAAELDDGLGPPPPDLDFVGGETSPTWTELVQGSELDKILESKTSQYAGSPGDSVGGVLAVGAPGLQGPIREIKTTGEIKTGYDGKLYYTEAALTEDVKELKGAISTIIPPEEAITPPWIADSYYNKNIGEKVYQPFFGVGSIVDEQEFLVEETSPQNATQAQIDAGLGEDFENYGGLSGDPKTAGVRPESASRVVVDPDAPFANLVSYVATSDDTRHISIAMALDTLSVIYGMVKSRGMDTSRFVWHYIDRPIATLPDLLGDRNFQLDAAGRALSHAEIGSTGPGETLGELVDFIEAINTNGYPKEGLHSRAVASLENLTGLLTDENGLPVNLAGEDQKFKRADGRGGEESIAPSLDQRVERKSRILEYVAELKTRALVG